MLKICPQALFKHWNGSQWSIYPDPAAETETVSLRAIAADSPSDVWVVGGVEGARQPLIQHWNGSRVTPHLSDQSRPLLSHTFKAVMRLVSNQPLHST